MKYGFCTYFTAQTNARPDYPLLEAVGKAGFDFVELPLFLLEKLEETELKKLQTFLEDQQISAGAAANLFPDEMPLCGPNTDEKVLKDYLRRAFERGRRIGVKKITFASVPAWQILPGETRDKGLLRVAGLLSDLILPLSAEYDMLILLEPLRRTICNLVNTLSDAMQIIRLVNLPDLRLMADVYHMQINEENPRQIGEYLDVIEHVHIARLERLLPTDYFTAAENKYLLPFVKKGYDKTISFETRAPADSQDLKKALLLLKSRFE